MEKPGAKTGVLLVAFGPGSPRGSAALRRVQAEAERRFGLPVRWAFTSDVMRERLARARTKSDSVLKALRRMRFERYTHVAVQSLHVIPGVEYGEVAADVRQAEEEGGLRASLGLPLLVTEKDAATAARLLLEHMPRERGPGEAVVCMAHGSPHEADELYAAWGRFVSERDPDVHVACMKGSVVLDHILPRLGKARPSRVWLLPLLSVVGRHTLRDMAGEEGGESWKKRLEAAGFLCRADLRGLADGPGFVSVWMDRLEAALASLKS